MFDYVVNPSRYGLSLRCMKCGESAPTEKYNWQLCEILAFAKEHEKIDHTSLDRIVEMTKTSISHAGQTVDSLSQR